jgi:hypothetical protein
LPFVSLAPPSCTRCTHRGVETDRSAERCIAPPRCRERNTRNVFPFRQRPVVSSSAGWPTIAHHQHVDMRSASSGGPSASASQRDASRRGGASSNQVTEGETAAAWPMLAGAPAYSLSLSLSLSRRRERRDANDDGFSRHAASRRYSAPVCIACVGRACYHACSPHPAGPSWVFPANANTRVLSPTSDSSVAASRGLRGHWGDQGSAVS